MSKGREFNGDRKELHMYFGQGCVLYRKYNVYSGERYEEDHSYIYQDDNEIRERMDDIEWEEQYKKKCQNMLDKKDK
jgi:hypothetical protein